MILGNAHTQNILYGITSAISPVDGNSGRGIYFTILENQFPTVNTTALPSEMGKQVTKYQQDVQPGVLWHRKHPKKSC